MNILMALPILAPLLASALGLLLRRRPRWRDLVTVLGVFTATASAFAILINVEANGTHVLEVGGWSPELGIVLVGDLFAALVLPVALSIILVTELFAIGQRRTAWGPTPSWPDR